MLEPVAAEPVAEAESPRPRNGSPPCRRRLGAARPASRSAAAPCPELDTILDAPRRSSSSPASSASSAPAPARAARRPRRSARAVLDRGILPDFLADTAEHPRAATGRVARAPADLDDRRVEITGPAEPKMMINALNSGARVFMADLEDALSPTWANVVGGQAAIADAVRRTLDVRQPRRQAVPAERARSRRWSSGRAAGSSMERQSGRRRADLGLPVRLRAVLLPQRPRAARAAGRRRTSTCPRWRATSRRGSGTTSSSAAQDAPRASRVGTIRATVLIETILAAFEMDEILYELREHAAGLNAGRWDYLFSFIKKFRSRAARPARSRRS